MLHARKVVPEPPLAPMNAVSRWIPTAPEESSCATFSRAALISCMSSGKVKKSRAPACIACLSMRVSSSAAMANTTGRFAGGSCLMLCNCCSQCWESSSRSTSGVRSMPCNGSSACPSRCRRVVTLRSTCSRRRDSSSCTVSGDRPSTRTCSNLRMCYESGFTLWQE